MSSFEERQKEYYEKLNSHPDIKQGVRNHKTNTKRAKEVFFTPVNDAELLLADKVLTFFIDAIDMFEHIWELDVPSIEDNRVIGFYLSLIKALKEEDASEELFRVRNEITSMTPEDSAESFFDATIIFLSRTDAVTGYLQKQSDISDPLKFSEYYNIATGYMNGLSIDKGKLEDALTDPELLDYISRFVDSYHSKCQRSFSKEADVQKQKTDDKM